MTRLLAATDFCLQVSIYGTWLMHLILPFEFLWLKCIVCQFDLMFVSESTARTAKIILVFLLLTLSFFHASSFIFCLYLLSTLTLSSLEVLTVFNACPACTIMSNNLCASLVRWLEHDTPLDFDPRIDIRNEEFAFAITGTIYIAPYTTLILQPKKTDYWTELWFCGHIRNLRIAPSVRALKRARNRIKIGLLNRIFAATFQIQCYFIIYNFLSYDLSMQLSMIWVYVVLQFSKQHRITASCTTLPTISHWKIKSQSFKEKKIFNKWGLMSHIFIIPRSLV